MQAALEDFIGRVGDLRAGRQPARGGGGSSAFGIVLLVLLAGGVGLFVLSRRRRRREQAAEVAEVKANTRDDLVALGEDIRALVQMPTADPAANEDDARAVDAYDRANGVFETARCVESLQPAAEALQEGRYAMTSAKARLAGHRPPERTAPCFFDPRHRVPYWDAGPAYAPFYGGARCSAAAGMSHSWADLSTVGAVTSAEETSVVATSGAATSAAGTSAAALSRALLALLVALLVVAAPARADVQSAANALASDPVYVDPNAELADQVDADALRARIKSAGAAPLFIAVLPASDQAGSAGRTLLELRRATGRKGTYALAVGNEFRTLGDGFNAAAAGQAARAAHPNDLQATLEQFIDAAGKAQDNAGAGGSGIGAVIVLLLLVVVVGGGAALIFSRRRARGDGGQDGVSEVGHIEQNDEFVRLGDSIRALELDVTLGDPNPAAKADYDRAVEAYARANDYNAKGATTAADQALDEGLAAIASARERLAGRR